MPTTARMSSAAIKKVCSIDQDCDRDSTDVIHISNVGSIISVSDFLAVWQILGNTPVRNAKFLVRSAAVRQYGKTSEMADTCALLFK